MTPIFTFCCPGYCCVGSVTPAAPGTLGPLEGLHIANCASLHFPAQCHRLEIEAHSRNSFLDQRIASPPDDPAGPAPDQPTPAGTLELIVVPARAFPEVTALHSFAN